MNTEVAKKVVGYALGALAGASVGFVVATFVVDNFVEEEEVIWDDEEAIEEEPEHEHQKLNMREHLKNPKKAPVNYNGVSKVKPNADLSELAKKYRGDKPQEVVEENEVEEVVEEQTVDRSKPYFITREEFETEMMTAHQKTYLNLYEDDDVLVDAEDHTPIVNTPEKFLGSDGLNSWGKDPKEPDTVFIRNETLTTDYEITLIHGSFEDTVVGSKKARVTKRSVKGASKVRPTAVEVNDEEEDN